MASQGHSTFALKGAILPLIFAAIALLAGLAGFRLDPDSYTYASGGMYPSPVGGLIGRAGGMPLLVLVTALAAGAALAAVTGRRRLLLLALAGPWFLFPGVDALGLLPLLLLGRSRSSSAIAFALAGVTHGIAALCIIPALITPYGRAIAALLVGAFVAVLFTVQGELAGVTGGVGPIEHLAWTTRYLLPGLFLLALDRERHDREGATRRV